MFNSSEVLLLDEREQTWIEIENLITLNEKNGFISSSASDAVNPEFSAKRLKLIESESDVIVKGAPCRNFSL